MVTAPCSQTSGGVAVPCTDGPWSVGPVALDDRACGLPQDLHVHPDRPVVDVAQVQVDRLVPVEVRATADLPQAGEAGIENYHETITFESEVGKGTEFLVSFPITK